MIWAYIYKITNPEEGKCYIGSTQRTPEARWQSHKNEPSKKMKHLKDKMKYLEYEVIEYGFFDDDRALLGREDYYISKYKSCKKGYNSKYNTGFDPIEIWGEELAKEYVGVWMNH